MSLKSCYNVVEILTWEMHYLNTSLTCLLCRWSYHNQSCIFRVVQVIKSLQDALGVGNNLPGINDNVRERGLEQKCFLNADGRLTETGQISRCPTGCSRWWVRRPGRPGRRRWQFHGRYQQTIGPSKCLRPSNRWHQRNHWPKLISGCPSWWKHSPSACQSY